MYLDEFETDKGLHVVMMIIILFASAFFYEKLMCEVLAYLFGSVTAICAGYAREIIQAVRKAKSWNIVNWKPFFDHGDMKANYIGIGS